MNKKTNMLIGTAREVKTGPQGKGTGHCSTIINERFNLVGGVMKMSTINARSVNILPLKYPPTVTADGGGERDTAGTVVAIMTTGDTTVTYSPLVQPVTQLVEGKFNYDDMFFVIGNEMAINKRLFTISVDIGEGILFIW